MIISTPKLGTALALVLACSSISMLPMTASAQGTSVFDGSKARVNGASKLGMLTQEIASASCRISAGINTPSAVADMESARGDFNALMAGLTNGARDLGIPSAEKNHVIQDSLAGVQKVWDKIDPVAEGMASSGQAVEKTRYIEKGNGKLLDATTVLASDIIGKYSNPYELTQSDAMALQLSGRVRTMTHQMAKEVCGIATGSAEYGGTEALGQTVNAFQVSLRALIDGMPSAGISAPPTPHIKAELTKLATLWSKNSPAFDQIVGGAVPSASNVDTVAKLANAMQNDMDEIIAHYMLATAGQDDVYKVPLRAYAEEKLADWVENPDLIEAIKNQNQRHATLSQEQIDALDSDWRAQRQQEAKPLIADLLGRPSSEWLRGKQAETNRFVTEVFAMDNKGLNVAQSDATSDYWQGDESKWQKTYGNGSGDMHISEVEFDESTGTYQSQVSMAVRDPQTGELIGAITFGVNVPSLL